MLSRLLTYLTPCSVVGFIPSPIRPLSVLWTSLERLSSKLMRCGEGTRSVLTVLSAQVAKLSAMACSPSTCNVGYVMTCLNAAQRALDDVSDTAVEASEQVCRSVKLRSVAHRGLN